jgi:hypothetical protein
MEIAHRFKSKACFLKYFKEICKYNHCSPN